MKTEPTAPAMVAGLAAARSSGPPGATFRAWENEADFDRMAEVFEAARTVDGTFWILSPREIAADARATGEPEETIVLVEAGDEIVGWTSVWDQGLTSDGTRTLAHRGYVRPAWRDRGIGRALLASAQANLRTLFEASPSPTDVPVGFESSAVSTASATRRLLERDGYRTVRYFIEMVRPDLDDPPPADLPVGITSRPPTPADFMTVARALNEAFKDHRAWPDFSDDQLAALEANPLRAQYDIWQVAWDGDEVVGGVLGYIDPDENAAFGRQRGYTEAIFTRRPWRGRGIARALIGRNLRVLRERGMIEAALTVDTENPSGALGLYERQGFRESGRIIAHRRDLGAETAPARSADPPTCRTSGRLDGRC